MISLSRLFFSLITFFLIGNAVALNFEDYELDMKTRNLPLILIVGCGHKTAHSHKDSWCVDLEEYTYAPYSNFSVYDPVTNSNKAVPLHEPKIGENGQLIPYWECIGADAELNIKGTSKGCYLPYHCDKYCNKFDIVVLERPCETTLENPWTLFNAVTLLKVGGELIVDQNRHYENYMYIFKNKDDFRKDFDRVLGGAKFVEDDLCWKNRKLKKVFASYQDQYNLFPDNVYESSRSNIEKRGTELYGENFNSENIFKKLETFKAFRSTHKNCTTQTGRRLSDMGDYLAGWFLTDIVAIQKGYQPYADRADTEILSATKTQETANAMMFWRTAINRNESTKHYDKK